MQSSMAEIVESSSTQSKNDKPVIVRVKRKAFQSPLDAFWLEINERSLKRPLLDFEKLSISDSSAKVEESKTKKVFVQHVETLSNSDVNIDILQSFVQPDAVTTAKSISKSEERRRTFKTESKQDQLLVKAKKEQEVLSKNARFEQIWRRRKGTKDANHDEALHEMCHIYDVVRVDVTETTNEVKEQENTELEDHRIMSSFLPLLREFIPSAASEIESEIDDYMSKGESKDDYVYDLYAVKDDIAMTAKDASNPFPLVQVDEDDGFYDGPDESENESYDSNAEDNPLNEYPDEETSEDEETESRTSADISEDKNSVTSDESLGPEGLGHQNLFEDEINGDDDGEDYDYDDDGGSDNQSNYY